MRDCPSISPRHGLPCALPDDGEIHYLGHRTRLHHDSGDSGPEEHWATTSRDWRRWEENRTADLGDAVADVAAASGGRYVFGPVSAAGYPSPLQDRRVHTLDLAGKELL